MKSVGSGDIPHADQLQSSERIVHETLCEFFKTVVRECPAGGSRCATTIGGPPTTRGPPPAGDGGCSGRWRAIRSHCSSVRRHSVFRDMVGSLRRPFELNQENSTSPVLKLSLITYAYQPTTGNSSSHLQRDCRPESRLGQMIRTLERGNIPSGDRQFAVALESMWDLYQFHGPLANNGSGKSPGEWSL